MSHLERDIRDSQAGVMVGLGGATTIQFTIMYIFIVYP